MTTSTPRATKFDECSSGRSTIARTANACSSRKRTILGPVAPSRAVAPVTSAGEEDFKGEIILLFQINFSCCDLTGAKFEQYFSVSARSQRMIERFLELIERIHMLDCG